MDQATPQHEMTTQSCALCHRPHQVLPWEEWRTLCKGCFRRTKVLMRIAEEEAAQPPPLPEDIKQTTAQMQEAITRWKSAHDDDDWKLDTDPEKAEDENDEPTIPTTAQMQEAISRWQASHGEVVELQNAEEGKPDEQRSTKPTLKRREVAKSRTQDHG